MADLHSGLLKKSVKSDEESFSCFEIENSNVDKFTNQTHTDNFDIFDNCSLKKHSKEVKDTDFDFFDDNKFENKKNNEKNELYSDDLKFD